MWILTCFQGGYFIFIENLSFLFYLKLMPVYGKVVVGPVPMNINSKLFRYGIFLKFSDERNHWGGIVLQTD